MPCVYFPSQPATRTYILSYFPPVSTNAGMTLPRLRSPPRVLSYSRSKNPLITITCAPCNPIIILIHNIIPRHNRKLRFLQNIPQSCIARVGEFLSFQLCFIAYPVFALGISTHRPSIRTERKERSNGKYRGSAPASNSSSTMDEPASHSERDKPFTKRTALWRGVSASKRSIGSTSRPSWSSRRSRTSSIVYHHLFLFSLTFYLFVLHR